MLVCIYEYEILLETPFEEEKNIVDGSYYLNQNNGRNNLDAI